MPLRDVAYAPYANPEEFIIEWTDRIWVDRGAGTIYDNYAENALVHTAYGTTQGVQAIVESTVQTLGAFPDRIGQTEDVVWEPRGEEAFVSSHRVLGVGPDTASSAFGAASHRHFVNRGIAVCLYRRGKMIEEWVVRDELAVVQGLGADPDEVARRRAFSADDYLAATEGATDPLSTGASGPRPDRHRGESNWPST